MFRIETAFFLAIYFLELTNPKRLPVRKHRPEGNEDASHVWIARQHQQSSAMPQCGTPSAFRPACGNPPQCVATGSSMDHVMLERQTIGMIGATVYDIVIRPSSIRFISGLPRGYGTQVIHTATHGRIAFNASITVNGTFPVVSYLEIESSEQSSKYP